MVCLLVTGVSSSGNCLLVFSVLFLTGSFLSSGNSHVHSGFQTLLRQVVGKCSLRPGLPFALSRAPSDAQRSRAAGPYFPLSPVLLVSHLRSRHEAAQSCPALCDPMDCSPPGSSVHGILQARVLEGLPLPSPGDLPNPGIEPRSPALQADALPSDPPGKPRTHSQIQGHEELILCFL